MLERIAASCRIGDVATEQLLEHQLSCAPPEIRVMRCGRDHRDRLRLETYDNFRLEFGGVRSFSADFTEMIAIWRRTLFLIGLHARVRRIYISYERIARLAKRANDRAVFGRAAILQHHHNASSSKEDADLTTPDSLPASLSVFQQRTYGAPLQVRFVHWLCANMTTRQVQLSQPD